MMAKNTSILIDEYFESYISEKVKSGKYASASEVVRAALRLFEQQENKTKMLENELKAGEKSGMISNFDREKSLSNLHTKYLHNEI
jgi:antitoxin ParD1/3/4